MLQLDWPFVLLCIISTVCIIHRQMSANVMIMTTVVFFVIVMVIIEE